MSINRTHVNRPPFCNCIYRWTEDDIEVASSAAIHFVKAFYKSMDNVVERLPLLGQFYTDRSTLTWNGTKRTGLAEIGDLLANVPPSASEVLSVDCQPIAGTPFPRLLVTVQGAQTHVPPSTLTSQPLTSRLVAAFYTPVNEQHVYPESTQAVRPEEVPPLVYASGLGSKGRSQNGGTGDAVPAPTLSAKDREDLLPRMFYEVFVLANVDEVPGPGPGPDGTVPPPSGGQQPTYTILSDTFRFVG
ncbi:hypothetical protein QFC21_006783 [Naganishia friedmannii]|uniref:Uncharacterized protein n=1 Tax=Naganishia friedmannii TaxID=89922 RepID=A0ACC2V1Q1_9TREE|nr:hypothetical protein QFC21_006783 [Naganishia friedmannii]